MEARALLGDLFGGLEQFLREHERDAEAALVERIGSIVQHAPSVEGGLDQLYRVKQLAPLALRLMWCVHRGSRGRLDEQVEQAVFDDQIARLAAIVVSLRPEAERLRRAHPGYVDPEDALRRLMGSLGDLSRSPGDVPFRGLDPEALDRTAGDADVVFRAATAERQREIAAFAEGIRKFCAFIRERRLVHDPRSMRLLGNAHISLRSALDTAGAEAYDSLRHTTHLLNNPETVFS